MGYTTEFIGSFEIDKPLDTQIGAFINLLADSRRMKRSVGDEYGIEGEFYVRSESDNILDHNQQPSTQPSLWCQWIFNENENTIEWYQGEKFYCYDHWLVYIIEKILKPNGYTLNGEVQWSGEDPDDVDKLYVKDNVLSIKDGFDAEIKEFDLNECDYIQSDVVYKPKESKKEPEPFYPEHEKLKEVQEKSQIIGEFLDNSKYILCDSKGNDFFPVHGSIDQILAEYFAIDLDKLEEEKRQMLESIKNN